MSAQRDDLPAILRELSTTLDELGDELGSPPRGPRDLLRFTERYTIPTMIGLLRAQVRLLELLAGAIRYADGRLDETEVPGPGPDRGDRAARSALDAVDRALADLSEAATGEPRDPEARRLLERARDLRDEATRLVEGRPGAAREAGADVGAGRGGVDRGADRGRSRGVEIDVESELDQVRREVDAESGDTAAGTDDGTGEGDGRGSTRGAGDRRDG